MASKINAKLAWATKGCRAVDVRLFGDVGTFSRWIVFPLSDGPLETMGEEKKLRAENNLCVMFGRGYDVCIMGIDGTWRRDSLLKASSIAMPF